jgi:hypothetical protein
MTIDCDECGQPSESLAVSLYPAQNAQAVKMLTAALQQDGWFIFHEQYRCPDCLLEALAAQQMDS